MDWFETSIPLDLTFPLVYKKYVGYPYWMFFFEEAIDLWHILNCTFGFRGFHGSIFWDNPKCIDSATWCVIPAWPWWAGNPQNQRSKSPTEIDKNAEQSFQGWFVDGIYFTFLSVFFFFLWGVAIYIYIYIYNNIYIYSYAYLYIYRYVISSDLGQTLTCFTEKNSLICTNYNHVWWGREVGEIVLFWLVHLPLFQA